MSSIQQQPNSLYALFNYKEALCRFYNRFPPPLLEDIEDNGRARARLKQLLIIPKYALAVAALCRPVILSMISEILSNVQEPNDDLAISLIYIMLMAPHTEMYIINFLHHSNNDNNNRVFSSGKKETTECILLGMHYSASWRSFVAKNWLASLFPLFLDRSTPDYVRWCAIQCISLALTGHMSDTITKKALSSSLSEEQCTACALQWQNTKAAVALEMSTMFFVDTSRGTTTNTHEQLSKKRKYSEKENTSKINCITVPITLSSLQQQQQHHHHHHLELPVAAPLSIPSSPEPCCVLNSLTSTQMTSFTSCMLALVTNTPTMILVQGPPSCGKSTLIHRHLAAATGQHQDIVTIHLDDQTDSKTLLGAYICTSKPGEFVWQPGLLTHAMTCGCWVVIENINLASAEVISMLVPLIERRTLHIPSRGEELVAAQGFQLFGTITTGPLSSSSGRVKDMLGGLVHTVRMQELSHAEQLDIVTSMYPDLGPLIPHAIASVAYMQRCLSSRTSRGAARSVKRQNGSGSLLDDSTKYYTSAAASPGQDDIFSTSILPNPRSSINFPSTAVVLKWARRMNSALHHTRLKIQTSSSLANVPVDVREAAWVEAIECLGISTDYDYASLLAHHIWAVPTDFVTHYMELAKPSLTTHNENSLLPLLTQDTTHPYNMSPHDQNGDDGNNNNNNNSSSSSRARSKKTKKIPHNNNYDDDNRARSTKKTKTSSSEGIILTTPKKVLQVGRAFLPIVPSSIHSSSPQTTKSSQFAQTGYAMRMMERIAVATSHREHVLLIGETGTGKTTIVQEIARQVSAKLVVINLSQQTDSSDLIGGFRPLQPADAVLALLQSFVDLVRQTWSKGNNEEFLDRVLKMANKRKWQQVLKAYKTAGTKIFNSNDERTTSTSLYKDGWKTFIAKVEDAEATALAAESGFAFGFFEGALVQAVREGWWLLLDEINLAPAEALERISGLLESDDSADISSSITVSERGDFEAIERHPHFRLFAAMNPATDAGKKDLPSSFRGRFTEVWVGEPQQREDLSRIVASHLIPVSMAAPVDAVVDFYLDAKQAAEQTLQDGAGHKPTYNLRTLSRALEYAAATIPVYGMQRALYDGFAMSFLTQLDPGSSTSIEGLLQKHFIAGIGSSTTTRTNIKAIMNATPPAPSNGNHVLFDHYWVEVGSEPVAESREADGKGGVFVSTPTVMQHLRNIARAVLLRKYPTLLQGPTSSGKTSLVAYLAAQTGHRFVRINNHEQTDLQEYLGTYCSDEHGRLVFQEGLLVQAVRHGYWIVLDELNLAPTEVLEALNRLLDDNRELFVPELQEVVKPHPHFMLFATQNPPGLYAGRKVLSRAFRSRFLEIHVEDIPDNELHVILERRCAIAPSYAAKLVEVMRELQRRRALSNVFAGRHGFITPRDLFRWAGRGAVGYEQLAQDGYAVLGERLRSQDERDTVQQVLEKILKTKIDMKSVYDGFRPENVTLDDPNLIQRVGKFVWTSGFRRMYWLLDRCLENLEPALLVGETGIGKTSVCQLAAFARDQTLRIINCNQHTESSDFLGGYRPNRSREQVLLSFQDAMDLFNHLTSTSSQSASQLQPQNNSVNELLAITKNAKEVASNAPVEIAQELHKLANIMEQAAAAYRTPFEWVDGPLVLAMKQGDILLIDEINLAEDAVLERLNSVLESTRTLTLAEKGGINVEVISAHPDFRVIATMNPGGDYGKKELSPALANRFTSIWVPSVEDQSELNAILNSRLKHEHLVQEITPRLLQFWQFYSGEIAPTARQVLSIRDLLTWIEFINSTADSVTPLIAYAHGAHVAFIDGIGMGVGISDEAIATLKNTCTKFLISQIPESLHAVVESACRPIDGAVEIALTGDTWGLAPFFIERSQQTTTVPGSHFDFNAPTTAENTFRVLRAMQLKKPILLEGSPGVGKTSLIAAIAKAIGRSFVRINLSEQTDMMDLLGADLPTEGGSAGEFAWSDGPLLQAIKAGSWVLLDELNLANQSVLEGLNALLDHRAEVFIPELNKTFHCIHGFRIFGAQNPLQEGGGRKGLPKSFLNRFSRVHVELLQKDDLLFISTMLYADIPRDVIVRMVDCLHVLQRDARSLQNFGSAGGPWEFNLRDLLRWCELITSCVQNEAEQVNFLSVARHFAGMLFVARMRTQEDRCHVVATLGSFLGEQDQGIFDRFLVTPESLVIGASMLSRSKESYVVKREEHILSKSIELLEAAAQCIAQQWMCLLVGPSNSGKTEIVRSLATLCGRDLLELPLNIGTDTSDLLGGFEQVDIRRKQQVLIRFVQDLLALLAVLCIEFDGSAETISRLADMASFWSQHGRRDEKPSTTVSFGKICLEEVHNLSDCIPEGPSQQIIAKKVISISQLIDAIAAAGDDVDGRFEWVDGSLTRAIIEGRWVVLDNANLCNPSVLDRLNPLLEPHGVLYLNECGTGVHGPRVITPHPDFRLFLTCDSKYGEVSRAMRNRGLELFLLPDKASGLASSVYSTRTLDSSNELRQILGMELIPGLALPSMMVNVHSAARSYSLKCHGHPPSIRDLKRWACMLRDLCSRGIAVDTALQASFHEIYVQVEGDAATRTVLQSIFTDAKLETELGPLYQPTSWPLPLTIEAYCADSTLAIVSRDLSPLLYWLGQASVDAFKADVLVVPACCAQELTLSGFAASILLPGYMISQLLLGKDVTVINNNGTANSGGTSAITHLEAALTVYQERGIGIAEYCTFSDLLLKQCPSIVQTCLDGQQDIPSNKIVGGIFSHIEDASKNLHSFFNHPYIMSLESQTDRRCHSTVSSRTVRCLQEAIAASVVLQRAALRARTTGHVSDTMLQLSQWRYENVRGRGKFLAPHPAIDWFWPLLHAIQKLEEYLFDIGNHVQMSFSLMETLSQFQDERWSFLQAVQVNAALADPSLFTLNHETLVFAWMRLHGAMSALCEALFKDGHASIQEVSAIQQLAGQIHKAFKLHLGAIPDPLLWKHGGKPMLPPSEQDAQEMHALIKLSSCMAYNSTNNGLSTIHPCILRAVAAAMAKYGHEDREDEGDVAMMLDESSREKKDTIVRAVAAAMASDISLRQHMVQAFCLFWARVHLKEISNGALASSNNVYKDGEIAENVEKALDEAAVSYAEQIVLSADSALSHSPVILDAKNSTTLEGSRRVLPSELITASPSVLKMQQELLALADIDCSRVLLDFITYKSTGDARISSAPVLLSMTPSFASTSTQTMLSDAVGMVVTSCGRSIQEAVPYQMLSLVMDAFIDQNDDGGVASIAAIAEWRQAFQQSMTHEAWYAWLSNLWEGPCAGQLASSIMQGPMQLHLSTVTANVSPFTHTVDVPLHNRAIKLLQLRIAGQQLQHMACASGSSKGYQQVVTSERQAALSICISTIAAHFSNGNVSNSNENDLLAALHHMHDIAVIGDCDIKESMLTISQAIQQTNHTVLQQTWSAHLAPAMQLLFTSNASCSKIGLVSRGQAWIHLGVARLFLCIPPLGADPAAFYELLLQHTLAFVQLKILPERDVRRQYDDLPGSPSQLEILSDLSKRQQSLEECISQLEGKSPPRPTPPQYMAIRDDIIRFVDGIASQDRVCSLMQRLSIGDGDAVREAQAWVDNTGGLISQLTRRYPCYKDIIQPVQVAIQEMRYGFGLLLGSAAIHKGILSEDARTIQQAGRCLLAFPYSTAAHKDGRAVVQLESSNIQRILSERALACVSSQDSMCKTVQQESASLMLRLKLLRASLYDVQRDWNMSTTMSAKDAAISRLHSIFNSFLMVWEDIKAEEARREAEEAELFKRKTRSTTVLSEEEEDEADFKEQFPDQFAVFADLAGSDMEEDVTKDVKGDNGDKNGGEVTAAAAAALSAKHYLLGPVLSDIVTVHKGIFAQHAVAPAAAPVLCDGGSSTSRANDDNERFLIRYETGMEIVEASYHSITAELDDDAITGHLYALASRARRLSLHQHQDISTGTDDGNLSARDIHCPCTEEAVLVQAPLESLHRRITELLLDWPDHPVLLQLQAIAGRISSMPVIASPLKTLLTGVELLLARAQVWEETAAKHVTLGAELKSVAAVATRWRKLELASWRGLLHRTVKTVADSAYLSWFHLHRIFFIGDSSSRSVGPVLEDFLQSAPLGEFECRLSLLLGFHRQLLAYACIQEESSSRSRELAAVLYNTYRYYQQFLSVIQTAISQGVAPHEKDLKDFVALAKWEDRGFYAMKSSTEKAQRHLHKLCRRVANVLKEPARSVLASAAKTMSMQDLSTPENIRPVLDVQHQDHNNLSNLSGSSVAATAQKSKKRGRSIDAHRSLDMDGAAVVGALIDVSATITYEATLSPLMIKEDEMVQLGKYTGQLPALMRRFTKIVGNTLVDHASQMRAPALHADELAGEAAQRAIQLRHDVAKGAKARKKKALVDLLRALSDAKISKLRSTVPAAHRGVNSWFAQNAPSLQSFLESGDDKAMAVAAAWTKADAYHYASMARLQRLFEAATHPSTDLLPGEVEAACRMSEHLFYLTQSGRSTLTTTSAAFGRLDDIISVLCNAKNLLQDIPPQQEANALCNACRYALLKLSAHVEETHRLLAAVADLRISTSSQAKDAGALLSDVHQKLQQCSADIHKQVQKSIPLSSSFSPSGDILVTRELAVSIEGAYAVMEDIKDSLEASPFASTQPGWHALVDAFKQFTINGQSLSLRNVSLSDSSLSSSKELLQKLAEEVEHAVESCLLWAQAVMVESRQTVAQQQPAQDPSSEHGDRESIVPLTPLPVAVQQASLRLGTSHLERLLERLSQAFSTLTLLARSSNTDALQSAAKLIASLGPLLKNLRAGVWHLAARTLALHRSIAKLTYVISALFAGVVEEGYCMPGGEADGDVDGAKEETMQGTGLGEGDTRDAKDITDELEDQDQLLGAQQKDQEHPQDQAMPPEQNEKDSGKGIEMDDDFEGALEDVQPDDGGEKDDESEDEEGDEDRIDQQMGDVGDRGEDVDERLWNQEDEEDAPPSKEEKGHDKDNTVNVDDASKLEYATGQEEQDDEAENQKDAKRDAVEAPQQKDPRHQEEEEDSDGDMEEQGGQDKDDELGEYEDRPEDRGHVKPEAPEEEIELPDDLNLDGEDGEEEEEDCSGGRDGEEEGAEEQEDVINDQGGPFPEQHSKDGGEEERHAADKEQEQQDEDKEREGDDDGGDNTVGLEIDEELQEQQEEDKAQDDESEEDVPMLDAGQEDASANKDADVQGDGDKGLPAATMAIAGTDAGKAGEESAAAEDMQTGGEQQEAVELPQSRTVGGSATGAADGLQDDASAAAAAQQQHGGRDDASQLLSQRQDREANPFRNLGSAMERWKSKLKIAADAGPAQQEHVAEEQQPQDAPADDMDVDGGEYRFLGKDEAVQAGDTQALATATEEQAAMHGEDAAREMDQDGDNVAAMMHEDEEERLEDDGPGPSQDDDDDNGAGGAAEFLSGQATWAPAAGEKAGLQSKKQGDGGNKDDKRDDDDDAAAFDERDGDVDGNDGVGMDSIVASKLQAARLDDALAGEEESIPQRLAPLSTERAQAIREELDVKLRAASGHAFLDGDIAYGHEVWACCEALTTGLVGELAEQLRLILEPTLATKMGGEYRTGKRINMKKVIGYIASHFRKDKIWMRRTKPDKRSYQVLIAIDDSRSMAETGCGTFALEAVTLICKAMARLEVGEMGIISFGGSGGVEPLHALDKPFTDADGVRVMSRMRFDQDNTIGDQPMVDVITSVDHILEGAAARASTAAAASSGADLHQLVLIIADGRFHEKEALRRAARDAASRPGVLYAFIILDNAANSILDMQSVSFEGGKPVFTKYIDTFPFPFYIVLRDTAALPRTLADLLRQWFELSSG